MTKKRILVVDDDDQIGRLLKRYLESEGYETVVASSGQEALDQSEKQPIDLVILDVFMPGLTGLDVLLQLKRKYPQLPVLMLTSNQDEVIAISAFKLGAYDYVMKPFDWSYLKLAIQSRIIQS